MVTTDFVSAPADFERHARRLAGHIARRNRRSPVWTWQYRSMSMEWERGLRAPSTVPECLKDYSAGLSEGIALYAKTRPWRRRDFALCVAGPATDAGRDRSTRPHSAGERMGRVRHVDQRQQRRGRDIHGVVASDPGSRQRPSSPHALRTGGGGTRVVHAANLTKCN